MIPQGSSLIDTGFFDNLIAQADAIELCPELQAMVAEAMASINAELTALRNQIASLLPVGALISPPTDLGSAISWITNFISAQLQPLYGDYLTCVAQLAALEVKIAQLIAALTAAAARITNCTLAIPLLPGLSV